MSLPLSPDIHVTRAREVARLLAKAQVRGFSAYKSLPANYSDEIALGFLPDQRVNSAPVHEISKKSRYECSTATRKT